MIVYVLTAWSGFGLGQLIADMLHVTVLSVGPVHVFSGTLGAWIGLAMTRLLVPNTPRPPEST